MDDPNYKWKAHRLPCAYAVMYPMLCDIAREHGYALAIHGSMTRDFDLVAVPWVADAKDPLTLVTAIKEAAAACIHRYGSDHLWPDANPVFRPHGRRAYALHFTNKGGKGPYIDISVMPRSGDLHQAMKQLDAANIRIRQLESQVARLTEACSPPEQ